MSEYETSSNFFNLNLPTEGGCTIIKKRPIGFNIISGIKNEDAFVYNIMNKDLSNSGLCVGAQLTSVNNENVIGRNFDDISQLIKKSQLPIKIAFSVESTFDILQKREPRYKETKDNSEEIEEINR
eukprot:UN32568